MERLTKKGFNFTTNFIKRDIDSWSIAQCLKKLQEYEDAEEQGLLLPCKVGDTLYAIGFNNDKPVVYESVVLNILIAEKEIAFIVKIGEFEINSQLKQSMFGKTVFLTKAEAEQKLNEMVRDEDNEG